MPCHVTGAVNIAIYMSSPDAIAVNVAIYMSCPVAVAVSVAVACPVLVLLL